MFLIFFWALDTVIAGFSISVPKASNGMLPYWIQHMGTKLFRQWMSNNIFSCLFCFFFFKTNKMGQWVRKVLAMQAEGHEFDPQNLWKRGKWELAALSWPLSLFLSLSHLPSLSPSSPHQYHWVCLIFLHPLCLHLPIILFTPRNFTLLTVTSTFPLLWSHTEISFWSWA